VQMSTWSDANIIYGYGVTYLSGELYVDLQQTLKPDDDYVLRSASSTSLDVRRTRLSTVRDRAFPVAAARLWNSLPSHVTAVPSLSPSSAVILNHISSHFLIPLSNSSLICTVPTCYFDINGWLHHTCPQMVTYLSSNQAWLVLRYVTICGQVQVCNQPFRSTQPSIPPG